MYYFVLWAELYIIGHFNNKALAISKSACFLVLGFFWGGGGKDGAEQKEIV